MTDLRKAAEMALEDFENLASHWPHYAANMDMKRIDFDAIANAKKSLKALRQALAERKTLAERLAATPVDETAKGEQEPVTLLPDGSAFGVMSFPLPESHWLYAEREYRDGEHEPIELGKPILNHELRDAVVSAVRYAIRGATNCGKEMDFDPDALVQNAVYALCGPYTRHVDAVNKSQALAQPEQEPVAWISNSPTKGNGKKLHWTKSEAWKWSSNITPLYTAPPKRQWVGLTDADIAKTMHGNVEGSNMLPYQFARAIEQALKEKNT